MKNLIFSLLFISVLLFSCDENNDDDNSSTLGASTNTQTMSVSKNGVDFTITDFNNTLMTQTQNGETGKRLDLRCDIDGGALVLTVSNWDWQTPPTDGIILKSYHTNLITSGTAGNACQSINGISFCDGGLITYINSGATLMSTMEDNEQGNITITSNNTSDKIVSGSFMSIVKDFHGNDSIKFEGTFSNLKYSILN